MKVDIKNIDATRRELRFEVPKEMVSEKLNKVYKEIGKEAKVKGFRPGKVPRHLLEQKYGRAAQEEVIKQLIPEVYQEAIEKESLNPIDFPDIEDVEYKDGVLRFTAKLDVKPEVKIKNYKGIKVKRKSSVVSDEEIQKTLDYIKKGHGGKEEVTIDDAFARGLGYPNLEEFKNSLRRQLEIDKDRQNRVEVENQIMETLLKNTTLSVPQSVIKKQIERRIEEQKQHLKSHGLSEEDIEKRINSSRRDIEKGAERDLKLYFILEKIAEEEKIPIEKGQNIFHKVMEFLLKEANWEEAK